jgi:hypothetical protein
LLNSMFLLAFMLCSSESLPRDTAILATQKNSLMQRRYPPASAVSLASASVSVLSCRCTFYLSEIDALYIANRDQHYDPIKQATHLPFRLPPGHRGVLKDISVVQINTKAHRINNGSKAAFTVYCGPGSRFNALGTYYA